MTKRVLRTRPRKADRVAVAWGGPVVQEDLPFPFVHYPKSGGTFFTFSRTLDEESVFCSCSESAVHNYIRLYPTSTRGQFSKPLRMAPLDSLYFSESIAQDSLKHADDPMQCLHFEDRICHRCQMKTPSLRYCLPMYGGQFDQMYGWYVSQARLRSGVGRWGFLSDVCPPEIQELLQTAYALNERCNRLVKEFTWSWSHPSDKQLELERLRKEKSSLSLQVYHFFENETRREFGVRAVGEGWVSESVLCQIVSGQFPGCECRRHFRPPWLAGLELDIFIPDKNIAFEYQGQQHFYPVKHWGGQEALDALRIRDVRKAELCRQRGVFLIAFDFTEPLTEQRVRERMLLARDPNL